MSMSGLRLVADDLTGALDSGCAFAGPAAPVRIALPGRPLPEGGRLALSTESRDMAEADAVAAVTRAVRALGGGDPGTLWFKKIDSVMRGHPFAETKAALDAGGFSRCVFAPAYPEMGRLTLAGRQHLAVPGAGPHPVGPAFAEAFAALGLPPGMLRLIDADSQAALRQGVREAQAQDGGTLWVGTGGLAAALGGGTAHASFPPLRGVIVGTAHPATRAQAESALAGAVLQDATEDGPRGAPEKPWLFAPALTAASAGETTARLARHVPAIDVAAPAETAFFVTGGDTLSTVLAAMEAAFLECTGQAAPGVPVARVHGGRWHGVTLLTKSGGFGDPGLLLRLLGAGRP